MLVGLLNKSTNSDMHETNMKNFYQYSLHLGLFQKAEQRWSRFTAVAVQAVGGKGVRALLKTINPEDLSPRFRNCAACAHQLFIGPNTAGFYAS